MRRGAVIFDFDGVLADSEPLHERAVALAARDRGWDLDLSDFGTRFVGQGDRVVFHTLAADAGDTLDEEGLLELITRKRAHFRGLCDQMPPSPLPGSLELLRACAAFELSGGVMVGVGVCTGSRRAEVEPLLERFGVRSALGSFVTADDVHRTKPDPACYALSCANLGVEAARSVAIEDSPTGIASAKAAGLRVIAVEHSFAQERLTEADAIVRTIEEITLDMLLQA